VPAGKVGCERSSAVKELVETIVKALVDRPEDVEVHEVQGQHSCVIELKVAREDIGKVIGKRGVHAQALRTIITAAGGKKKKRYVLEILEDRD
jgi:uncharacterized protein